MVNFIVNNFRWFTRKIKADGLDAYSAQSAFFILIAFIPFLILMLSLFRIIDIEGTNAMEFILELLPHDVEKFVKSIILIDYQPVTILSVAGFTCIWSSSKATMALIKGLNSVYDSKDTRNYFVLRLFACLYTLAFAVILAVVSVVLVFGNSIYRLISRYISPNFIGSILANRTLWGFILLALFFCFTYKFVPYKVKIPFKYCLIGATLSAFGWIVFSFFFSIFIENFSNYSNMYGSLTALVVLMLWLYFCMYILLFGAEISVWMYINNPKEKNIKIINKS